MGVPHPHFLPSTAGASNPPMILGILGFRGRESSVKAQAADVEAYTGSALQQTILLLTRTMNDKPSSRFTSWRGWIDP